MKSKRMMHFHLWNIHFLFIIDLYSPTLYKWNDQLEKWNHWNENEIWNQMKENGNEPDIIFMCISILYFFMFISLFQSWTSSYFRDRSFGRNGWCSQIPLPFILSLSKRKHIVIPVVIRLCVFINQIKWMNERLKMSWNPLIHRMTFYHSSFRRRKHHNQIDINSEWYQSTKWNCERWEC